MDDFAILGVERGADRASIRSAYTRLARALHPDTGVDGGDEERFIEVALAYERLSKWSDDELNAARPRVDTGGDGFASHSAERSYDETTTRVPANWWWAAAGALLAVIGNPVRLAVSTWVFNPNLSWGWLPGPFHLSFVTSLTLAPLGAVGGLAAYRYAKGTWRDRAKLAAAITAVVFAEATVVVVCAYWVVQWRRRKLSAPH